MYRQDYSDDIKNLAICVVQQARLQVIASKVSLVNTSARSSIFFPLHGALTQIQENLQPLSTQLQADLAAVVESLIINSFAEKYLQLECRNCSRTYYHKQGTTLATQCEPTGAATATGLPCDYYEPSIVTHNEEIKEIRLVIGQLVGMGVHLDETRVINNIRQVSGSWLEKLEQLVDI